MELPKSQELEAEVRPHNREIILGQAAHQFVLKVISARSDGATVAFLERPPALVDVFLQTVVQILVAPSFSHFRLVVELDLVNQQAGEALRLAMDIGV